MKSVAILPILILTAAVSAEPVPPAPFAGEGRGGGGERPPAALFADFCAGCHGQGREPLAGSPYPALFGNPQVAAAGATYVALKALRGTGNMYPLCALASDAEITAIANWLAAANGNPGPALTPEVVAALRPAVADCSIPH
jgi:mono/diheme cytochrome c family protein